MEILNLREIIVWKLLSNIDNDHTDIMKKKTQIFGCCSFCGKMIMRMITAAK